jgi:hypothetical protein
MSISLHAQFARSSNPIDVAEELVGANDWNFSRHSDRELMFEVAGQWSGYQMYFLWQHDIGALFFSCQLELRVPDTKRSQVFELLATVNENLWIGHFDLVTEGAAPVFRHTVPLRGAAGASAEQLEDLIDAAVVECERFYPALQMVVWGGRSIVDALTVARMDTIGRA